MMLPSLSFTKMHGLGNDIVIIDNLSLSLNLKSLPIPQLSNRQTGIGFDQLIILEPSKRADFFCRIYNADGSEATQCGNGLRCVARFIHEEKQPADTQFNLETLAGVFSVAIKDHDHIRVSMGVPLVHAASIVIPSVSQEPISHIAIGNHHAIVKVAQLDGLEINRLAPLIMSHAAFQHQAVNVGFMQIIDAHHARLRTFEHGVGETKACGSNACAAAVAGITHHWLTHPVEIAFHLGSVTIEWGEPKEAIYMTGPAARVFDGELKGSRLSLLNN